MKEPKQGIDIQEFEKKANEIIANVGKKEAEEKKKHLKKLSINIHH